MLWVSLTSYLKMIFKDSTFNALALYCNYIKKKKKLANFIFSINTQESLK